MKKIIFVSGTLMVLLTLLTMALAETVTTRASASAYRG